MIFWSFCSLFYPWNSSCPEQARSDNDVWALRSRAGTSSPGLSVGYPDPEHPELRRPTGDEMAARLSYLFWGTMPDEELRMAAQAGELSTKEGVRAQAERMLDASGSLPGSTETVSGPTELVKELAETEEVHGCFATRWTEYAYGLTLRAEDACTKQEITTAFKASGYNVKQLLIDLTQTDAFHYISVAHQE
ncbi:DUF1585 domain-containing protein [Sorangium sp. So ce291]|uniref:DUF1585 domain-containing protein n=1 Tax=Sorangium sp. So ce291 TaxID=3133294 RepID=UPI003F644E84